MTTHYYEIINPSDHVLLVADESDELAVAIAVLVLGDGKAGVRRDDDVEVLPLLIFGGADNWLKSKGITAASLKSWVKANRPKIATVLESVFYGDISEAKALDAALAALPHDLAIAARARYNDSKRSSLSDWGAACLSWAKTLREAA